MPSISATPGEIDVIHVSMKFVALKDGIGIKKAAKLLGCGIAKVYRVKNEASAG
jgi:hypothetical protein